MVATTGNATTKDVEVIVKERVIMIPTTGTPLPRTFEYPEVIRKTRHDYQACALIPTGTSLQRTLDILKERAMRARHD